MQSLIEMRWMLLIMGAIAALAFFGALSSPGSPLDYANLGAAIFHAAGTYAMRAHLAARAGWPVLVGWLAVAAWVIEFVSAGMGVAAGPGGLVIGLLVTLPALAVAVLAQIASLIGFARREKAGAAP